MRTQYTILIASLLILSLPAAAADPSYEVPDAAPVADAANAFAQATHAGATGTAGLAATQASDASDDVTNATLPASRAVEIAAALGTFGVDTVGGVNVLTDAVSIWLVERVENKRAEAFATADAGVGVGVAALGAADAVLGASVEAVCAKPLLNSLAGDQCNEDSLVNATRGAASDLGSETQQEAQQDRTVELRAAIESLVGNIVQPPL